MSLFAWESLMFNYFQWDPGWILKSGSVSVKQESKIIVCMSDEVVMLGIRPKQWCNYLVSVSLKGELERDRSPSVALLVSDVSLLE